MKDSLSLSLKSKSPLQAVRNSFLHAAATYPVDLNRVYTVGYSGGCRGRVRHDEEFSAVSFVTARLCEIIRQHLAPSLMNELGTSRINLCRRYKSFGLIHWHS